MVKPELVHFRPATDAPPSLIDEKGDIYFSTSVIRATSDVSQLTGRCRPLSNRPGSFAEPPDADPHVRWCGRGEL